MSYVTHGRDYDYDQADALAGLRFVRYKTVRRWRGKRMEGFLGIKVIKSSVESSFIATFGFSGLALPFLGCFLLDFFMLRSCE